ncbi:MAG: hypothetical protein ACRC8W_21535, partial [Plesiomonas shigelloides]
PWVNQMSRVLTSFLVGLGMDLTEFKKGRRELDTGLGGIKSTILQTGAAMAGVFGAKALTVDFSRQTDQLFQFSNMIGVTADNVRGLGNAFRVAGGDEATALAVMQKLTEAKDVLTVKGEAGFLTDVAFAGIDPTIISQSANAYEALLGIIGQFDKLSPDKQRVLANTLGLSPAEVALFKTGRDSVQASIDLMKQLRPATEANQEAARQLRGEWALFGVQAQGIADQISTPLVSGLADMTKAVNDFLAANRPLIGSGIDRFVKFTSDNFTELAGAAALIGAGTTLSTISKLAKFIPAIGTGIGTLAAGAARLSFIGGAVTTGAMLWDWKPEDVENVTGWKPPEWLFKPIGELWDGVNWGGNIGEKDNPYMRASREASQQRADWYSDTTLTPSPTMHSQRAVAVQLEAKHLPPIQVQSTLNLNGQVLEQTITEVNARHAQSAMEDLTSTTDR